MAFHKGTTIHTRDGIDWSVNGVNHENAGPTIWLDLLDERGRDVVTIHADEASLLDLMHAVKEALGWVATGQAPPKKITREDHEALATGAGF